LFDHREVLLAQGVRLLIRNRCRFIGGAEPSRPLLSVSGRNRLSIVVSSQPLGCGFYQHEYGKVVLLLIEHVFGCCHVVFSLKRGYELLLMLGTRIPIVKKRTAVEAIKPRKKPRQKRSADTVAVIVEAAARILETNGFEGFNTNAIAEKAGVSIGSLYQYFASKHALLSAIIEREAAPMLGVSEELVNIKESEAALRCYIRASIRHQTRRPHLARLIDVAEKREVFGHQVRGM
jgi:Bacterial regulatory proteins, tetR family